MTSFACVWLRLRLIAGAAVLAAAGGACAVAAPTTITINFHAGPGEPALLDTAGALIAAGAEVRIGWLDAGFDAAENGWNPAAVAGAFHEFGRTGVREIFGEAGRFAGVVSGAAGGFTGKTVALWIVLTPYGELAGPNSNVTAHALVTSTAAGWVFPSGVVLPPGNAATIAFGEADQFVLGIPNVGTAANMQLAETGYRYSVWRDANFAAGATNAGPGDDADGDGSSNLVEFFAGTDPLVAGAAPGSVTVDVDDGGQRWLVLSLQQSPLARGVEGVIESSIDRATWTTVTDTALTGDGATAFARSGRVPAPDTAAGERRYLRAVVRSVP